MRSLNFQGTCWRCRTSSTSLCGMDHRWTERSNHKTASLPLFSWASLMRFVTTPVCSRQLGLQESHASALKYRVTRSAFGRCCWRTPSLPHSAVRWYETSHLGSRVCLQPSTGQPLSPSQDHFQGLPQMLKKLRAALADKVWYPTGTWERCSVGCLDDLFNLLQARLCQLELCCWWCRAGELGGDLGLVLLVGRSQAQRQVIFHFYSTAKIISFSAAMQYK